MIKKVIGVLIFFLPLLFAILYWEYVVANDTIFIRRWGTPSGIFIIIWNWIVSGYLWPHIWSTFSIALAGLVIGAISGISLAVIAYRFKDLGLPLGSMMAWLNSLPRVLLVPIFIGALGIGLASKLAMVVAMTVFVFFFNMSEGLSSIDKRIVLNARLLGASRFMTVWHVHLPLSIKWLLACLRPAIGFAVIGAIISEYLGAISGIGYVVDLAYGMDKYDRALAGMMVIFVCVGLIDFMLRLAEYRWLHNSKQ